MYRGSFRSLRFAVLASSLLWFISVAAMGAAPNVRLHDLNGQPRSVSDYIGKGKWAVVIVWSADCTICQRDMYHMTFLREENKTLMVLGLSIDGLTNRDKALAFVDEQSLNFPNLIGAPGDATRLSGNRFVGTPTYYFFTPGGRFATQRVGTLTQSQAERVLDSLKKTN